MTSLAARLCEHFKSRAPLVSRSTICGLLNITIVSSKNNDPVRINLKTGVDMPTKYKAQLNHVGFDWGQQPDLFQVALARRELKLLEALNFDDENYAPFHAEQGREAEIEDLLRELTGILLHAASVRLDGGYKATNKVIATIEAVAKNPELLIKRTIEPEALGEIARCYRRADEPADTYGGVDLYEPKIAGVVVSLENVRAAAYAAIAKLQGNSRVGNIEDVLVPLLAMKFRSLYLRYNDTCTRTSILAGLDGKQEESGKFFAFLKIVIDPLNKYLSTHRLKPVSVAAVARAAVENRPREEGRTRWWLHWQLGRKMMKPKSG